MVGLESKTEEENATKSSKSEISGIGYAYNYNPQGQNMEFYPPPWAGSAYPMVPFPPSHMMMPGLPPGMPPGSMHGMCPVTMSGMSSGAMTGMPNMSVAGDHSVSTSGMMSCAQGLGSSSPPSAPARERFSYTRYQLELLNAVYAHVRYPNCMQKQLAAKRVGITRDQVKIWFQNRRRKDVTGKSSAKEDYLQNTAKRMVPEDLIQSVITEMMSYENDPKGKQIKTIMTKNLEEKKRKANKSKTRKENNSPSFDDADTNQSYASSSSPASTVNSNIGDSLFASDEYQPNNVNYQPDGHCIQNELQGNHIAYSFRENPPQPEGPRANRSSYPFHSISEVFADASSVMPPPMAGQALVQPVQVPVSLADGLSQSSSNPEIRSDTVVNIASNSRGTSPVAQSLTPLTPASCEGNLSDSYTSIQSSPINGIQHMQASEPYVYDVAAPPNAVVVRPHTIIPLKRSRCEDSSSEDDEEVEPPRKRQERLAENDDNSPPNKIAPPSEPIKYSPNNISPIPNSQQFSMYPPRQQDSAQDSEGDDDRNRELASFTTPNIREPIPWPPHHWPSVPQNGGYPFTTRLSDMDYSAFSRPSFYMPHHVSSKADTSTAPTYGYGQGGYSWDLSTCLNNNNNVDTEDKERTDRSAANHYGAVPPDTSKIPPYSYDCSVRYPPVTGSRQELFTPWLMPFPGSYCHYPSTVTVDGATE